MLLPMEILTNFENILKKPLSERKQNNMYLKHYGVEACFGYFE